MIRDHGGAPEAAVDASVNLNPLGPPDSLDAVFARARELAGRYPQIDAASAREAWARHLEVPFGRVLVGNGASELISLAVRAIEPRRVIVFDPGYSEYAAAARAAGVAVSRVPLVLEGDEWLTPIDELLGRGADGEPVGDGDLVIVGQPNNPSGHLTPLESVLALARAGVHVLADESFLALVDSGTRAHADSLVSHAATNVTAVASLTKTFCVPGLRLGYLVADEALVDRITGLRDPWSVNGIAVEAAVVLSREGDYLERSRNLLAVERSRVAESLAGMGVRVTAGIAPWVLARLPHSLSSAQVCDALLADGVAVRDASTFVGLGDGWIRIGIRNADDNGSLLASVRRVIESHA